MKSLKLNPVPQPWYYPQLYQKHGQSVGSLGWKNKEEQYTRFKALCSILPKDEECSLLDVGAGFGDLKKYLIENDMGHVEYFGIEKENCFELNLPTQKNFFWADFFHVKWNKEFDYCIASGAFNLTESDLFKGIVKMSKVCKKGFSFNFLKTGQFDALRAYSVKDVDSFIRKLPNLLSYAELPDYLPVDGAFRVWVK